MHRGLFALALILLPFAAHADLININTADLSTLETLPGIGATKGQAIIDYRTQHGSFAQISDIQNVSGIGPATYAQIQSYITVGSAAAATNAPTATTTNSSSGAASAYVPPPSDLVIDAGANRAVLLNVPVVFSAAAKTRSGAVDDAARISWAFGDGSAGEGRAAFKTYRHPGTYVVSVKAVDGETSASDDLIVTVRAAAVRIASSTVEGITIANDASDRLDLSGWRLYAGVGFFRFPEGTFILPGAQLLFPSEITNLPVAEAATLYYPSGVAAAYFPAPVSAAQAQPPALETGSQGVQSVEPAAPVTEAAYEDQSMNAPAAASPLAAAGAAVATSSPSASRTGMMAKLAHSPWTIGFLGVVAVAGGALMIL